MEDRRSIACQPTGRHASLVAPAAAAAAAASQAAISSHYSTHPSSIHAQLYHYRQTHNRKLTLLYCRPFQIYLNVDGLVLAIA